MSSSPHEHSLHSRSGLASLARVGTVAPVDTARPLGLNRHVSRTKKPRVRRGRGSHGGGEGQNRARLRLMSIGCLVLLLLVVGFLVLPRFVSGT
jgi:hypothetical protein